MSVGGGQGFLLHGERESWHLGGKGVELDFGLLVISSRLLWGCLWAERDEGETGCDTSEERRRKAPERHIRWPERVRGGTMFDLFG